MKAPRRFTTLCRLWIVAHLLTESMTVASFVHRQQATRHGYGYSYGAAGTRASVPQATLPVSGTVSSTKLPDRRSTSSSAATTLQSFSSLSIHRGEDRRDHLLPVLRAFSVQRVRSTRSNNRRLWTLHAINDNSDEAVPSNDVTSSVNSTVLASTSTALTNAPSINTTQNQSTEQLQQQQQQEQPLLWIKAIQQWFADTWTRVAWHAFTFIVGAVMGVTALIWPLYATVVTPLQQPVTLFETILSDLEQAYVEPVDTNQLFETGVAAMLRSLDPYTEFEGVQEARDMSESIEGRYGGVGLVIAGIPAKQQEAAAMRLLQPDVIKDESNAVDQSSDVTAPPRSLSPTTSILNEPTDDGSNTGSQLKGVNDEESDVAGLSEALALEKIQSKGVRVVSAFEGYAFDYGLRVGDKLVGVDDFNIDGGSTSIEQVRNALRGVPGTMVSISFERDGVKGVQTITMPRAVVKIRDVKLATLMGDPANGIGYIQLSGFASDAGREMRTAIQYLQRAAEDASQGERSLQGLVLDLRGNPGGLLTSAVDVASLLVPKGSDIVSAKGRGFPGIMYRSRVEPILDTSTTKLAVLVNGNTASAAEIVSGAVQDLDVGVIVGAERTFGKGLVQNVEELPYNTALKFTVAKYYTPSGRCIQGVTYKEGDKDSNAGMYVASKVQEKDRGTFYTRTGRVVRDGGGIEADFKIPSTKISALELILFRSGVFSDFAAEWSKTNELTNNFAVDEDTYKSFQAFVNAKQKSGELELQASYSKQLGDLKKALKVSGYKGSEQSVEQLEARIVRDMQNDFEKFRREFKEDISQSILARYIPESMLIERGIRLDPQVEAAVKLLASRSTFDKLLAKGSIAERLGGGSSTGLTIAGASASSSRGKVSSTSSESREADGFRSSIKW